VGLTRVVDGLGVGDADESEALGDGADAPATVVSAPIEDSKTMISDSVLWFYTYRS